MTEHVFSSKEDSDERTSFAKSYPELPPNNAIPGGDMPGDKVLIGPVHLSKAQAVFPHLLALIAPRMHRRQRTVVSVHGGSGVGKSEVGALLGYYLNHRGIDTYVLSGDNYPHRIPMDNDYQRILVYREWGLKGLVSSGEYQPERNRELLRLQADNMDADPDMFRTLPWMSTYQTAGRRGLAEYLGSPSEIDFNEVNSVLAAFHNGAPNLWLRRMGRQASELWYDQVDLSNTEVLLLEWTHGNSRFLDGINIPILLYSTPEETLEHRRRRNRDGAVDSPFTSMVLRIEQEQILAQTASVRIIVKNDATISFPNQLEIVENFRGVS